MTAIMHCSGEGQREKRDKTPHSFQSSLAAVNASKTSSHLCSKLKTHFQEQAAGDLLAMQLDGFPEELSSEPSPPLQTPLQTAPR